MKILRSKISDINNEAHPARVFSRRYNEEEGIEINSLNLDKCRGYNEICLMIYAYQGGKITSEELRKAIKTEQNNR